MYSITTSMKVLNLRVNKSAFYKGKSPFPIENSTWNIKIIFKSVFNLDIQIK